MLARYGGGQHGRFFVFFDGRPCTTDDDRTGQLIVERPVAERIGSYAGHAFQAVVDRRGPGTITAPVLEGPR